MKIVRVPTPAEGNPNYPLPPDYLSPGLSAEERRLWRINACRQWLIPRKQHPRQSVEEMGAAFAASVRFFDRVYLYPDESQDFDPMFYDEAPRKTPGFHMDILRQWGGSERNISIAPRGSAKSALARKAMLLRLLTRPMYSIFYATSTTDNARETALALKMQFQDNQKIADDFNPEFGGHITPSRAELPFGIDYMVLTNGSRIRLVSAESRLRGGRPRRFVLDDPEFDAKEATSMALIRTYMSRLVFKIVLPMIMRPGCGVDWLGTYVSRKHYAWVAMQTHENIDGIRVAEDPRFDHWNRLFIPAAYETEDNESGLRVIHSCWPDMWPPSQAYKLEHPEVADRKSLDEIEAEVGTATFRAEFLGQPGAGDESYFGELVPEKHGYVLEQIDEHFEKNPRQSNTRVVWYEDGVRKDCTLKALLPDLRLFMTADTSYTAKADSDFKAVVLMGTDRSNNLFVLDAWAGQKQETELIKRCFQMADRWRCPIIWAETVKEGISLFHGLVSVVQARAKAMMGVTHLPGIKKIVPGQQKKEDKIATLGLRFQHGKIKFPLFLRGEPIWRDLYNQIDEFNPEAADGGLQHDDLLDCVAMSMFTVSGRSPFLEVKARVENVMDRLKEGNPVDELGMPIMHGLDFSQVPAEYLQALINSHRPTLNVGSKV